jgi:hypothetical protein
MKYPENPATDLNSNEAIATRTRAARKAKNQEAMVNMTLNSAEQERIEAYGAFTSFALMTSASHPDRADPLTVRQALSRDDTEKWKQAMREELDALKLNDTYEPTTLAHGPKATESAPIGCKWVYKTKVNADNTIRCKARLVIKGFQQVEGVDFDETYAPVSKMSTLQLLLTLSVQHKWKVEHFDVVTAFLNPKVDQDDLFMALPEGVDWLDPELAQVCTLVRLIKALYRLKQALRLWWKEIDGFLVSCGLTHSAEDPNLYIGQDILVLLYVDDMLIVHRDQLAANLLKSKLKEKYHMTDLGIAKRFLGMEINYEEDGTITLSQSAYIDTILAQFQLTDAYEVASPMGNKDDFDHMDLHNLDCEDQTADIKTYQSMVGSLMYVALGIHPDISHSVMVLSRFSQRPLQMHLTAAKRVLRYLKTTKHLKLCYTPTAATTIGYMDSDFAGRMKDRKSVGGYMFLNGGPISWRSRSQTIVALSSLEAEYIGCSDTTREAIWLR